MSFQSALHQSLIMPYSIFYPIFYYSRIFSIHNSYLQLKLKSIYDIIPAELNKQNKKFVFTMLDKELKVDRYENSFLWLKVAGNVANKKVCTEVSSEIAKKNIDVCKEVVRGAAFLCIRST